MNGNMNLGKRVTVLEKGAGSDIKKEISDLQASVSEMQSSVTTVQEEITNLENKVNSGHVYSTEEKVVGTWYNGKTLYEKGYVLTNVVTLTTEWIDIMQINEQIEKLAYVEISDPNYVNNMCLIKYENGHLKGLSAISALGINSGSYITIRYTKTE